MHTNKESFDKIAKLHENGLSWSRTADTMNKEGMKTATGKHWNGANAASAYSYWKTKEKVVPEADKYAIGLKMINKIVNAPHESSRGTWIALKTFMSVWEGF